MLLTARMLVGNEVGINEACSLSVSWDSYHLPPEIRAFGDLVENFRIMECGSCYCCHHKYVTIQVDLL